VLAAAGEQNLADHRRWRADQRELLQMVAF
jgi:hypothetical protein